MQHWTADLIVRHLPPSEQCDCNAHRHVHSAACGHYKKYSSFFTIELAECFAELSLVSNSGEVLLWESVDSISRWTNERKVENNSHRLLQKMKYCIAINEFGLSSGRSWMLGQKHWRSHASHLEAGDWIDMLSEDQFTDVFEKVSYSTCLGLHMVSTLYGLESLIRQLSLLKWNWK